MKKFKGSAAVWITVGIVAVVIVGILSFLVIDAKNRAIDYSQFDLTTAIEAGEYNGNIADHVEGNAEAPIMITEYTNFGCNHCADARPIMKQVLADNGESVAIISRNVSMPSFKNSKAAAAAAEAAGLQGYWSEYVDLLFEQQAEWYYAEGSNRDEIFEKYFEEVSDGKGDLNKFKEDMASDAVAQKLKFDSGVSNEIGVQGTPSFFVNGQFIDRDNGGEVTLPNGKVVRYEKQYSIKDMATLIEQLIAAQNGADIEVVTFEAPATETSGETVESDTTTETTE